MFKKTAVWCAASMPVQWVTRRIRRNATVFLTYHGVCRDDEELETWTLVRESSFRLQMEFLKDTFDCLSIDEALEGGRRNMPRPAAVVTFDDGYANNVEVALPVLAELEIPATVYVTTRNVVERRLHWHDMILTAAWKSGVRSIDLHGIAEPLGCYSLGGSGEKWYESVAAVWEDVKRAEPGSRDSIVRQIVARFRDADGSRPFEIEVEGNVLTPFTPAQIAQLAAEPLVTIGAHSHGHDLLDRIPADRAAQSIRVSKQILEDLTDREIRHFAYPNGNYSPVIIDMLKKAGFVSAVTTHPGWYKRGSNPYEINRHSVGAWTSLPLLRAQLTELV